MRLLILKEGEEAPNSDTIAPSILSKDISRGLISLYVQLADQRAQSLERHKLYRLLYIHTSIRKYICAFLTLIHALLDIRRISNMSDEILLPLND